MAPFGYHFVEWTGTGGFATTTDNPVTVTNVTADTTLTAHFEADVPVVYTVNYVTDDTAGATVSEATTQVVSGGDALPVLATAPGGYHFVNWTGTGGFATTTDNPVTVTNVTADTTLTAHFEADVPGMFTVTYTTDGTPGSSVSTDTQTVASGGSAAPVTATAPAGYHFVNWTGTPSFETTTANPVTVTNVTANMALTAHFAVNSNWVPVYRFFQLKTGSHFFTSNEAEMQKTLKLTKTYNFEGIAFQLNTTAPTMVTPLFRFFNTRTGVHFYTASTEERDDVKIKFPWFNFEGEGYKVISVAAHTPNDIPVYRFFNRRAATHFYTSNEAERQHTIDAHSKTFSYEGVGYYLAK
jgi:uncharacterized repeat protein (TIGR02543 family)